MARNDHRSSFYLIASYKVAVRAKQEWRSDERKLEVEGLDLFAFPES